MKKKKVIKWIGMGLMIIAIIVVFIVGDGQMSKYNDNKNEQIGDTNQSTQINYDSSDDNNVSPTSIFKTYEGEDFYLQLNEDKTYIFLSKDNQSYFSGTYSQVRGNSVYNYISKYKLLKYGLNYTKINPNNLFFIRANYDSHIYGSNNEHYYEDIHNTEKGYFEFLIYFRQNNADDIIVAVKQINISDDFNISNGYF